MNAPVDPALKTSRAVDAALYLESSLREKILEHVLVGDLLRALWRAGRRDIEVLRAEVDRGGYDLVLQANGIVRHIQLKSSYAASSTADVNVHVNLARKPGGCVLWVLFDPTSFTLGPFLWLGGAPGQPLPDLGAKVARHSKGDRDGYKAERPNHRTVGKGKFTRLNSMEEVVGALFGEPVTP
jgi:hypothetical protein